jgi:hypothetical protein
MCKEERGNTNAGRCPLCFGTEDVQHILLDCLETNAEKRFKLIVGGGGLK